MIDIRHKNIRKNSLPRTGREIDAMGGFISSSGAGSSGGSSGPTYWKLIATDEAGEPLEEGKEYIHTDYSAYTARSFLAKENIAAYTSGKWDLTAPLAGYEAIGMAKFNKDHFLITDGLVSLVPGAGTGGVNFVPGAGLTLSENDPKTLSVRFGNVKDSALEGDTTFWGQTVKDKAVTGALTGVTAINNLLHFDTNKKVGIASNKSDVWVQFSGGNSINGVMGENATLGNLYLNYGDTTHYVKIDSNQNLLVTGNIVAYAAGNWDLTKPLAGYEAIGMAKFNKEHFLIVNGLVSLAAGAGSGGIDFTPGAALELTDSKVLNVLLGDTSTTACAGNDSRLSNPRVNPYALTFTGFSTGSYTGASALTVAIPTNTNQLDNGAGYIKDGNGNITMLIGSGDSSTYLAGNGSFYRIGYNQLSGTPDLSVYVKKAGDTMSGNLTINKNTPSLYLSGTRSWQIYESGGDLGFKNNGALAAYFSGTNNGNFVISKNLLAEGNVIAYSSGSWDITSPIAGYNTLGMIKVGSGLSINNGVLSVTAGGGGSVTVIDSLTSTSATDALSANQGYQLDQRLKKVAFGSSYTNYVVTTLGSTSKNLSVYGHSHTWSEITSKPSWIGSSKPSYGWSEITGKPSVLSSISYSISGSGNVVTDVTASGGTVCVTKGSISGGSWNGGTITSNITISRSDPGIALSGSSPFINFSSYWKINLYNGDFRFMYGSESRAYFSYASTGNMWIKGSLVQGSDMRRKTVVNYLGCVLKGINSLSAFRYTYKNDATKRIRIGLSAQQVLQCFPEFVFMEPDGYYSLDYSSMVSIAIAGVKDVYRKYQGLENDMKSLSHWKMTKDQQIEFLMKENDLLKARVAELEGRAV